MFDFIERLRQKSDGVKKRIAFLASFSVASLIFTVWFTVIYPDFSFKEKQKQTANASETGVFSSFVANMKEGIGSFKSQIDNVRESLSTISTSTHYTVNNDGNIVPNSDIKIIEVSTTTEKTTLIYKLESMAEYDIMAS